MLSKFFRGFLRRADGGATVETVIWFPFFIAVFGLMVDTAMIFHGQAKVLKAIQDGNRALAAGRITTTDANIAFITTALADIGITVDPALMQSNIVAGVVTTSVVVPTGQLQLMGYFKAIEGITIGVSSDQIIENWEV